MLVPHCLIAIRNCVDLSQGLLSWYTVWCFFLRWCHRPRLRPIRCRCPCHRATRWCSSATFISSCRAVLRRPRRRPCQDSRWRRRSTSIGLTTRWNRGTYVHAPPHTRRAILFASLYDILIRAGPFLFAPHQGSELLRAASSFKRRRESRTLRSAVPSGAFLFVVFVVFGPSDLGLCLTGALHYTSLSTLSNPFKYALLVPAAIL